MFASPRNDKVKCLANFALSYGKRVKTAELTANLPFGEFFRGRFAKQLCLIWGGSNRK